MARPRLVHEGLHTKRLTDSPCHSQRREQAFAQRWKDENDVRQRRHLLYELMLVGPFDPMRDRRVPGLELTQDCATAVASVVQWLGSNVGFSFVEESLRDAGYRITYDPSLEKRTR